MSCAGFSHGFEQRDRHGGSDSADPGNSWLFTPFYFIRAGSFVLLPALWTALGVIVVLLALKMSAWRRASSN